MCAGCVLLISVDLCGLKPGIWFATFKKNKKTLGSGMWWLAIKAVSHHTLFSHRWKWIIGSLPCPHLFIASKSSGQGSLSQLYERQSPWEAKHWNNRCCWRSGLWHIEGVVGECFFHDACLHYFWLKWMAFSSSFQYLHWTLSVCMWGCGSQL